MRRRAKLKTAAAGDGGGTIGRPTIPKAEHEVADSGVKLSEHMAVRGYMGHSS